MNRSPPPRLQWGRNLFVAERIRRSCLPHSQGGRFNGAATCSLRKGQDEQGGSPQGVRFNGAATCSLRKASASMPVTGRQFSFNGAATCSLRKANAAAAREAALEQLQWGRNLFVAESRFASRRWSPVLSIASMGPQLVRCGKGLSGL